MKVRCEYCHSMVDASNKTCPSCGSPLPEVKIPVTPAPTPAPAKKKGSKPAQALLLTAVLLLACWILWGQWLLQPDKAGSGGGAGRSVSEAYARIQEDPTEVEAYQAVISHLLEQGDFSAAYDYAYAMLMNAPGADGGWCVEVFTTINRRDLAARLALSSDVLHGEQTLFDVVADATVEELFPQSPLRQAMELFFGKPAGQLTLADLQTVTYLSVGAENRLTGGRTVSVGTDPDGDPASAVSLPVEAGSVDDGLGILFFQGLKTLEIRNTVTKQAELMLPRLTVLSIYGVQMEDLTPLSHLPALEELTLSSAGVPSLEGLEALPALHSLSLRDSKLTDLSLLPAHRGITELALLDNDELSGVSSLAQMTQLTSLSLSGDTLSDLSPIASLTGLKRLSVTDTAVRNTDFLSGMTNLEELIFTDNDKVDTIPQLAALPALTSLTLESDELFGGKDTLSALANLRALTLRSTKELSYLLPLENLEELTLYFYRYEVDISALSGFQHLRVLRFPGETMGSGYTAHFSGLNALRNLPLEELYIIGHTFYEPLDPVLSIPTLRTLDLSGVNAEGTNFSLFAQMSQLQRLSLRDFDDMHDTPPGPDEQYWSYKAGPASAFVDQLGSLTNLTWLDLAECGAEDISALAGLTSLAWLDLSGNDISDISVLKNLDALAYLNLSGNPIGDFSAVEGRDGLVLVY